MRSSFARGAEPLEASLLAHVVDASDPGFERQLAVTDEVLDGIGAQAVPRLLVSAQKERGQIFDTCTVLEERSGDTGAILRVRGEPEAVQRLVARFGEQSGRR